MFDAKKMSEMIREKKKKLMESPPELVGTSPTPDMNAQDIFDLEQKGRIEETLNTPEKIDADDTMMNYEYDGVGLSPDEKKRMGRLRTYFSGLKLDM